MPALTRISPDIDISNEFWVPNSVTYSDGKIYVMGRARGRSGQPRVIDNAIRRYSNDGVYESGGDVSPLPNPPRGTLSSSLSLFLEQGCFEVHNNSIYMLARWGSGASRVYTLERYNTAGTHQERVWSFNQSQTISKMTIFGGNAYTFYYQNGFRASRRNFTNGNLISTISAPRPPSGFTEVGMSLTATRMYFYVATGQTRNLLAYNATGTTAIAADNTNGIPQYNAQDIITIGSRMYIAGWVNNNQDNSRIIRYSGIALSSTVITAAWSDVSFTGGKLTGTLTFSGSDASGIAASDFAVIDDKNAVATGWTFDTPSTSTIEGAGITISATPPANTNGDFSLRLNATSVRGGSSTTDNSPAAAVASTATAVNNTAPVTATAFFHNMSYTAGGKLTGSLTFDNNVTGIDANDFEVLNASNQVQTGWAFDTPPTTATGNIAITISALPPANTNGQFKFRLKANSVIGPNQPSAQSPSVAVPSVAVAVDNRPEVAGASWSPVSYTNHKLTGFITFDRAVTGIGAGDFVVEDDKGVEQTGWTFDTPAATAAANTGITISASPPARSLGSYSLVIKARSVLGPRATTNNSPASSVVSSTADVTSQIVLSRTLTGTFGGLSLHANFAVNDDGIWVVNNNIIRAFTAGSTTFARRSTSDITLSGHPSSVVTWGFDVKENGDWVILTRERPGGAVGQVYVYSADGTDQKLRFPIPASVADITGETFRAPKSVLYWQGCYYVRVVRSVTGNMRILAFGEDGTYSSDKSFLLTESQPTSIRDAAAADDSPLYILTPGSPVGIAYAINPNTGDDITSERLVGTQLATGAEGIGINGADMYIATLSNVYVFTGVPKLTRPVTGTGGSGSALASILNIIAVNERMRGNMNRRDRR